MSPISRLILNEELALLQCREWQHSCLCRSELIKNLCKTKWPNFLQWISTDEIQWYAKKYKRHTTRWITNTFKVPAKKKTNKQQITRTKKSKTAVEDYEADLGDCSTFPRSTYINSLHNSSPHSPIARYTCVLTVSTLDFQHGTEEIFFSKETGLVLELAKQGWLTVGIIEKIY